MEWDGHVAVGKDGVFRRGVWSRSAPLHASFSVCV